MDFSKYGIVYALLGLLLAIFIATRLFPGVTLQDLAGKNYGLGASPATQVSPPVGGVTVEIDFGTEKKSYANIVATNAFEALQKAAEQENLEVETKQYDFGFLVERIGTVTNSQEKSWVYYVNGQSGDVAADKKSISEGDKVEWKYVKPQ